MIKLQHIKCGKKKKKRKICQTADVKSLEIFSQPEKTRE